VKTRQSSRQLTLSFGSSWGGSRAGAGRKRRAIRPQVPHRARPAHEVSHPVHVTLRAAFRSLRTQFVFPTVRAAISAANRRSPERFRVVEFSVQADHIHLIVEADSRGALIDGVRGLSVRIARNVNRLVRRKGTFFSDRWHGRALKCPRAVRHALVYVLANHRKHRPQVSLIIDPYSSAPYFLGFLEYPERSPRCTTPNVIPRVLAAPEEAPKARAETWLLARGWQRLGPLSVYEHPKHPA
jgi:REP element-mobilizing transposase RayT